MILSAIVLAASFPVVDFATNSVARRIAAAASPSASLSRFAVYPPRGSWKANDKFWLKGIDFTCASPWNDECGTLRAGTLISKRHIIFAKHFPLWKGCRVLFVDQEGEVCPCRVEATKAIDDTDIMIGLLDYEVTPNIHPAKILPENYADYIGDGAGLPVVTLDRNERAFLSELQYVKSTSTRNSASTKEKWKAYAGRMSTGDSGNPAFMLIGDKPILLYCLYSGDCGHGPSVHRFRREIQKTMDELCPGYKLESFDFEKLKESCGDRPH